MSRYAINVPADPDADDCLAAAAAAFLSENRALKGYDLNPQWADESHGKVSLTLPGWFHRDYTDTSGT